MIIGYDAKRYYHNFTGLGNYSRTLIRILKENYPENEYILYDGGAYRRTFGEVSDMKRQGVELFHGLSHEMPVGLGKAHIPSVVTMHDVAFKTFKQMYTFVDRQIYDIKWRYACNHSNRIIAISESTKRDVMRFYDVPEEKIDIVYQPVQDIYYTPITKEKARKTVEGLNADIPQNYMLYVGSIYSRKNLLSIVKALELLPHDLQIPLVIVGNGHEYKRLVQNYVQQHHLSHLCIWLKGLDETVLQSLYTCASLFVYPSFYEGFGLPVVEAMLCRCPVVTSNVSSLPEAGGPGSLKASPTDIEEISQYMRVTLEDETQRKNMIEVGVDYASRHFNPEHIASQLIQVYEKTVRDE